MKRILVLLAVSLLFTVVVSAFAQETPAVEATVAAATAIPDVTPAAPASDESALALQAAEDATERANIAIDSFDRFLSLVEAVGAILAVLAIILGVVGFNSLRDVQNRLSNDVKQELAVERAQLETLREQLASQTKALQDQAGQLDTKYKEMQSVTGELVTVRTQNDNAIRALTLVQLAEQQMGELSWRAAMRTLEEAYALDSGNRAVNYYLGELFIMERNLSQAEFHLGKAQPQSAGGVFPPAMAALGYVHRLKGDDIFERTKNISERNILYNDSEKYFRIALREDPLVRDINGESVHGMLGALLRQWGRMEEAIDCYEDAVRITPHRSYPLNNLAMLYYAAGNIERATHYFDQSIKLAKQRIDNNPTDYWAHFDHINAQLACARQDIARDELDRVLTTITMPGPLESFLTGLTVLAESPRPPEDIQIFVNRVERALEAIKSKGDGGDDIQIAND